MKDAEFAVLAKKAQSGDQKAYRELLKAVMPVIQRFIRKSVPKPEIQDDILQDVLMSLHKALHTYRPERSFKSWMFAIAKFRLIDHLRVHYRRKDRELLIDDMGYHAEDVTEEADSTNQLVDALDKLPEKYREAIKLTKLQELSVKEAATQIGVSENALKARCSRGYKMLKKQLEKTAHE